MSNKLRVKIGRLIREEREKQGLSQQKFALQAGIDRTYLSDVENGLKNVSIDWIEKVAKALNIPIEKFLKKID